MCASLESVDCGFYFRQGHSRIKREICETAFFNVRFLFIFFFCGDHRHNNLLLLLFSNFTLPFVHRIKVTRLRSNFYHNKFL